MTRTHDITTVPPLTVDDLDQIAEGIDEFIMNGNPKVDAIWQPYVDQLKAHRALLVAAPALLAALKDILAISEVPACHIRNEAVAAIARAEGRTL